MGAGVIPFSICDSKVNFLFQMTFTGRKAGYLIDFGGGQGVEGEDDCEIAIREFIEETETMYFSDDLQQANCSIARVKDQMPVVKALFYDTLTVHPEWCCKRSPGNPLQPKLWKTFFIEFPFRDIEELNLEWKCDRIGRFKKRRKLVWVTADELLAKYKHNPDRLWKRVRQLENATEIVQLIRLSKEPGAL